MFDRIFGNMLDRDPDLRDIEDSIRYMLRNVLDEKNIREITTCCLQTVAVYEYVESLGYCGDLWPIFIEKLESCDFNSNNTIDPREYANSYKFKLKCILTLLAIPKSDYKTLAQAVYGTANSEEYREYEKVIREGRESLRPYLTRPTYPCDIFLPF